MFRRRRGSVRSRSGEGVIPYMRGYRVVDTPFVPDQSYRDRQAIYVALYQSTRERYAEQRQAILRQAKDQDDPQIRQRVRADIKVYIENGRDIKAAEVSVDRRPAASIRTVAACGIGTSVEQ
jgi:hypothetical protein